MWLHREEIQGSHCSIRLPIEWALCALQINQYLTKDSKCIGKSTINILLRLVYLFIGTLSSAHKPIPHEDSKVFGYQLSMDCLISQPIQRAFSTLNLVMMNQYLTKIVSVFVHQLSMHFLISLPIE